MQALPLLFALLASMLIANHTLAAEDASSLPVEPSYTIRPGDVLQITVWKEEGMDREIRVLPDGTIDFPLIGSLPAAEQTAFQLKQRVTKKLSTLIPAASVTVIVKEPRGNSISIVGQVTRPGEIMMARPLNVMQALSQAGGLSTYADEDAIVVLRKKDGKETAIPFHYSKIAAGESLESNISLLPGDVIVVPTASLF